MEFSEWLEQGLDNRLCRTQCDYLDIDVNHVMRYESLHR